MAVLSYIEERKYLDPVFLAEGIEVYSNEYAQKIRKENLELKKRGKRIYDIIPQSGFQENVLTCPADIIICGGVRGAGKTAVGIIGSAFYAYNPDVSMYGFRRYEGDVRRGIWKSSKQLLCGMGSFADTSFEFKYFNGTGATFKMEHLADLSKVKDRFRGAEMPYILIEELAEFTKNDMNIIFDLMGSNRSTAGVRPRFICTCNPVGKSNKLRLFLDWWIDQVTDEVIPERSGKIRYFCRYGEDIMEIAWGNSPEEVYANPNAKTKIATMTSTPDKDYRNFITSVTFIDGDYAENKILHFADPKYMNRISAGGSKSVINDIRGVWRDVDDSGALITADDMQRFYNNTPKTTGRITGGGDIALRGDWFVQWALDGWHIIGVDAARWLKSDDVVPRIKAFQKRFGIADEDYAFDGDGIGDWLKNAEAMRRCVPFTNRGGAKDTNQYNSRKSECAGILIDKLMNGEISIEESVLRQTYMANKIPFSIEEKLMEERLVLKWAGDEKPRSLIKKKEMKSILGHSPDFIEALLYAIDRADNAARSAKKIRSHGLYMFNR